MMESTEILQFLKAQRLTDIFIFCLIFLLQTDLMVSGNNPVQAMTYIRDLKLFPIVFKLPDKFEPALPEEYHGWV